MKNDNSQMIRSTNRIRKHIGEKDILKGIEPNEDQTHPAAS